MIYLITGGERSGKSSYAMRLAQKLSEKPLFVATSRIWDEDFKKRVENHKRERKGNWVEIEEEKELSKIDLKKKVAVIDCVTLWLTNFWIDTKYSLKESLSQVKKEIDKLGKIDATLIIISNEIGMGTHSSSQNGRKFVELQGFTNQYIAQKSDKVVFMVSGIPLVIKK